MRSLLLCGWTLAALACHAAPTGSSGGSGPASGKPNTDNGTPPGASEPPKSPRDKPAGERIEELEGLLAAKDREIANLHALAKSRDDAEDRATDRLEARQRELEQREQAVLAREAGGQGATIDPTARGVAFGTSAQAPEPPRQVENQAVRVLLPSYIGDAFRNVGDVIPNYTGGVSKNLETGTINKKGVFKPDNAEDDDD